MRKFISTGLVLTFVLALNGVVFTAQSASAAVGVLFDTGHQMDATDIAGYSSMITDLTSQGFQFTEDSDGGITEEDLGGNHILVIVEPDKALSTAEINNIQSFIATGHNLLIMSDELDESARTAVNTLLSPYNIQQSTRLEGMGIYTDIASHAVTNGVSRYNHKSSGVEFDIAGYPALSLIMDGDGDTLVAAWQAGARVVVISDENSFRRNHYNSPDNNILIRNIFDWLSDVEPPVADFSAQPRTGEGLLNVQFIDRSIGNITYWLWDFGDGTDSNEQNPTHEYKNVGRYSIRLHVIGEDGAATEIKHDYINVVDVSGTVAEVEAAKFATSNIDIEPTQVLSDRIVSISVNVTNSGGTRGDFQVVLNINGRPEDSQLISLSPKSSRRVIFNVTRTIPGTYDVSIGRHKGQFIVVGSTPSAPATSLPGSPPNGDGLETPVIIGIILGSVGTAIAVIIVTRRRRRQDYIKDLAEKYQKVLYDLDKMKQLFKDKQ
jgi:PKD repeat protein